MIINSFYYLFDLSFYTIIVSFINSVIQSFVHSFSYSFIHSFIQLLIHNFIFPFTHAFTHLLILFHFLHRIELLENHLEFFFENSFKLMDHWFQNFFLIGLFIHSYIHKGEFLTYSVFWIQSLLKWMIIFWWSCFQKVCLHHCMI